MVYKRLEKDSMVNNYNRYLLKMIRAAMDLQLNHGSKLLIYLAKYLSKVDTEVTIQYSAYVLN